MCSYTLPMGEFEIIERYFKRTQQAQDVLVDVGDDAAVLAASGRSRVVCVDTLNVGVHFPENAKPQDIAYRALAANLSDLAAMGAQPRFCLLALSLPKAQKPWLNAFAKSFFALAKQYEVALIGGDLTRGPLSISITLIGEPKNGNYLTRYGAKPTDKIYVTGCLGGAAQALQLIRAKKKLTKKWHAAFYRPQPRIACGLNIASIASSCIDISDGLLADLKHILQQSQVGAKLALSHIPHYGDLQMALTGGEDFELCFTVPLAQHKALEKVKRDADCDITCIGEITSQVGVIVDENNKPIKTKKLGYQHF